MRIIASRRVGVSGRRAIVNLIVSAGLMLPARAALAQVEPYTSLSEQIFATRARGLWPMTGEAPVVFSFSGGISLGSYQAGVNWAMLEFIKRSHRDSAFRTANALPDISVQVMTGASAGSINVLLGSLQYCELSGNIRDTDSMLWKTWVVESGWDNLFPDGERGADAGVLDRSRLRVNINEALSKRMDEPDRYDPDCRVPIGVVATRVRPGTIAYDKNIQMPNQRFVGLFEARVLGNELRFVRARVPLLNARQLGAQLVLPANELNIIDLPRVFGLIEASSSYPIAFAPVPIEYQEPACVLFAPTPPGCTDELRGKFLDGGVFDNNPVSLAVAMQERIWSSMGLKKEANGWGNGSLKQRVLYVDPDAGRGTLKLDQEFRRGRSSDDTPDGVGALLGFGGGFVPSARSYELQSFTRSQSALDVKAQAVIRSSTRAHAVIGEHLGSFAAFLGRPFREFDFYNGMADGMQFVASNILCDGIRMWTLDRRLNRDDIRLLEVHTPAAEQVIQGITDRCIERETRKLAESAFNIEPVGRYIVQRVLRREYPTMPALDPPSLTAEYEARRVVLSAIEDATHAKGNDKFPYNCQRGEWAEKALCSDGFDRVLAGIRSHAPALAILKCRSEQDGPCGDVPHYPTSVEETYALVASPSESLDRIITRAFHQMRDTEKKQVTGGYGAAVKVAELAVRSAESHDGRRFDGGPTSIPRKDGAWSWLAYAPYYVGLSVGAQGVQFGWQPTYHFGAKAKGIALLAPIDVSRLPRRLDPRLGNAMGVAITPSIGFDLHSQVLNQISFGERFAQEGRWTTGRYRVRQPTPEISTYWLFHKIRAGAYIMPREATNRDKNRVIATMSISDINGALYWLLR